MPEVNVLLHADYLLTLHKQADDLRELVGDELPSGRSERYVVYLVLEGMTSTFFHALMSSRTRWASSRRMSSPPRAALTATELSAGYGDG